MKRDTVFTVGLSELALVLIVYAVLIYVLFWVYRDASRRYPAGSLKPFLWVLVVLFMHLVGLILYVLLRPEKTEHIR